MLAAPASIPRHAETWAERASRLRGIAGTMGNVLQWWYPEWDSNPQQAGFEPTASASWAIGASRVRDPQ